MNQKNNFSNKIDFNQYLSFSDTPSFNEILATQYVIKLLYSLVPQKDFILETNYLQDDLGLESLDKVYICMQIEEEFEVYIEDKIINSWLTVKDIIKTCTIVYKHHRNEIT